MSLVDERELNSFFGKLLNGFSQAEVNFVIAQTIENLIDNSFADSRGPDGKKWARLSARRLAEAPRPGNKPLIINGRRLRNRFITKSSEKGVEVTNTNGFWFRHNRGVPEDNLPRRWMAPEDSRGYAKASRWQVAIDRSLSKYFEEF